MDLKYQSTFIIKYSLNYITNKKNYSPLYIYFICIITSIPNVKFVKYQLTRSDTYHYNTIKCIFISIHKSGFRHMSLKNIMSHALAIILQRKVNF